LTIEIGGKSTLLRSLYPAAVYSDLLEADTFSEISAAPELIRKRLTESDRMAIIDKIQKLPALLDEVHHKRQHHFVNFSLVVFHS
jgi:uncharacterized protein